METFTSFKEFVNNPDYQDNRQKIISALKVEIIDKPLVPLIDAINRLPFCFTLQSCFGHFTYTGQSNIYNTEPLPLSDKIIEVNYRIAYICFCIEDSKSGRNFLDVLNKITDIDPSNIQFGCAEWFWERQVNTYILQVEPERFMNQDKVILEFKEALNIEKIRNFFFGKMEKLINQIIHDVN